MLKINFFLQILFYISIFCFLLGNSYSYLDPDLGWHLKVGQQIIKEKTLPNYDYYNFPLKGKKWVDHEWLMNGLLYIIYDNLGYLAVNIFFALIILAVLIILNILVKKYFLEEKNGTFFILFFQALGILALSPHLGVRIQEISLLFLSLLLFIIYHYEKYKKTKVLFFLPPLFYFWSSAHAGFLIGIFVIFFWLFVKILEIIISKQKIAKFFNLESKFNLKDIRIFFSFALFLVFITFLTPYGLKLYKFLTDYFTNLFYMTHIQEWLPAYVLPFNYWQIFYIDFLLIVIFWLITNLFKKEEKINLWNILISLIFIVLAIKSKRHFPLLFVVSFPFLIKFFSDFFDLKKATVFEKITKKIYPKLILIILFLIIIIIFQTNKINFISNPFLSFPHHYPQGAVEFLKNNPQYNNLNLFNPYGWGGYLLWTLPERKIFIDGRLPQYQFADHSFLEEYFEFFEKEKVEKKLNQYNIKLVLLEVKKEKFKFNWFEKYILGLNEKEIEKEKDHLKEYLENSKEWQMIYKDNISAIYVRENFWQN